MTSSAPETADEEEPLDPAAERVRRKLVRFMAINLGILFVALMAVVIALVYRAVSTDSEAPAAADSVATNIPGEIVEGEIALPSGARIVGQALSGDRLALRIRLEDGGEAIVVHDIAHGTTVGRFSVIEEDMP